MGKNFKEVLHDTYQKRYDDSRDFARDLTHRKTVRDTNHAFTNTPVKKPDPWKQKPLW